MMARVEEAAAVVARNLGDETEALRRCRRAIEILDSIGARPAADRLRARFGIAG